MSNPLSAAPRPLVVPLALKVMAAACFAEALVFLVFFAIQISSFSPDRASLGWTTAAFFALWGVMLAGCAVAVLRRHSWARSPLVLAQLIQLGLAYNFATDAHSNSADHFVAWLLAAVALVVLVLFFRRTSLEYLSEGVAEGDDA